MGWWGAFTAGWRQGRRVRVLAVSLVAPCRPQGCGRHDAPSGLPAPARRVRSYRRVRARRFSWVIVASVLGGTPPKPPVLAPQNEML